MRCVRVRTRPSYPGRTWRNVSPRRAYCPLTLALALFLALPLTLTVTLTLTLTLP